MAKATDAKPARYVVTGGHDGLCGVNLADGSRFEAGEEIPAKHLVPKWMVEQGAVRVLNAPAPVTEPEES